jgi:hypothetical protein
MLKQMGKIKATFGSEDLPGSDGQSLILVIDSDGALTGSAVYDAFSVPVK